MNMGIYAQESKSKEVVNADGTRTWTETWSIPGITQTRTVTASAWSEERTNCFCCSCAQYGSSDAYCRNHGWAAQRPCEVHGMPGQPDDDGVMPESVQKYTARWKVTL